ncbi:MAG: hypothetical protein JJU29_04735 [Verrucomicrobia bacterium]|nr:hypothetical protein [Verrucomicrobiota bacterium]MCH8510286.1 hypothetical protein [Kiritimatiellia bacterium]
MMLGQISLFGATGTGAPISASAGAKGDAFAFVHLWIPAGFSRISSLKGALHSSNATEILRFLRDLLFKKPKGFEQKQAKRAKANPPPFPSAPSAFSCSKNTVDWNGSYDFDYD